MQIFEVFELKEFPFMKIEEVYEGEIVSDILNVKNEDKVFLLIDDDMKRIWTYNGCKSSLKLQVYGGVLALLMRKQLRLFYRVFPLNYYSKDDQIYQEMMEKPIGSGRAKPIEKSEFSTSWHEGGVVLSVHAGLKFGEAIESINNLPIPEHFKRNFMIIGGSIYTEEEIVEKFVKATKKVTKPIKMGRLNNGFTFFNDRRYSTRIIIKERKVQGIELFTKEDDLDEVLELKIPIISEKRFNQVDDFEKIIDAFHISDQPSENDPEPK